MNSISTFTIFLLFSFFTLSLSSSTYGELSLKHTGESYSKYTNLLDTLNENSIPGDLSKLRKSIISARSLLDVFVYAYRLTSSSNSLNTSDTFILLRKDLNKLYTSIGNFDDLKNVNYSPSDAQKLLNKCLKYKTEFNNNNNVYGYNKYVLNSSTNKLFYRNKDQLSVDYWGNIESIPETNYTGYQNLAILAKGQLSKLLELYDNFINLTDIYDIKEHNTFHDYRKLIRGFNFVSSHFLDIFIHHDNKLKYHLGITHDTYSFIGKLNDKINEYQYYYKKNDPDRYNPLKTQIISDWKELIDWIENKNFIDVLQYLISYLIRI